MSVDDAIPAADGEFEDFFENSINGYLIASADGSILRANARVASWLGLTMAQVEGTRFSSHLTIGGKILYETHLSPLLRMQGSFSEVALELAGADGSRIPVFANGLERRDPEGRPSSLHLTLFKGEQRKQYEDNLRMARDAAEDILTNERRTSALREQFIAVLGHDLRNPLGAITMGTALLKEGQLGEDQAMLVDIMSQSASRISDLIADVMDFARGQLGDGISLTRDRVLLEPLLHHVVEELRSLARGRIITTYFDLLLPVHCDPVRICQLLSNLASNALTHGESGGTVTVRARVDQDHFELSVSNAGTPIPQAAVERLFHPFSRGEVQEESSGLGLGLYIASQIAKAHGGNLSVISVVEETRFTFQMPILENGETAVDQD